LARPPSQLSQKAHAAADEARLAAKEKQQQARSARLRAEDCGAAAKIAQMQLESASVESRRLEAEAREALNAARRAENHAKEEDAVRDSYSHSHVSMVRQHTERLREVTEDTIDYLETTFIKEAKLPTTQSPTKAPSSPAQRLRSSAANKLAEAEAARLAVADPEEVANSTMYRKIKGDQLCQLASTMTEATHPQEYDETVHRALDTYEEAINMCEDVLPPTDSLKVMLALKTSIALADLSCFPMDALVVAKKALLRSEKFRSQVEPELSGEEIEILQNLRDQVAALEQRLASEPELSGSSDRKMCDPRSLMNDENDFGGQNDEFSQF
jgi:hypothetical protein